MFDVSVIIPTHNRAPLLPAAMESVIAQTTPARIEVAVIDDGSTDDTQAVMQRYLQPHGDEAGKVVIRYTRLARTGVVTARNTGIAQTSAPLIAFLDSDDYWAPQKLEKQLALLERDPELVLVHTAFRYVDEQGQYADDGPQRLKNACVGRCVNELLREFRVIFSSVVVRRSIVEEIARVEAHGLPFDPRWTNSQDYDLVLRVARLGSLAYIPEPLTLYRLHGGHGAMGNLRKAYGFHSRVQIDFVRRYGQELGIDEIEARRRAGEFIFGRAQSLYWLRDLAEVKELCELARELEASDSRFEALERQAARPRWLLRARDGFERLLGRGDRG